MAGGHIVRHLGERNAAAAPGVSEEERAILRLLAERRMEGSLPPGAARNRLRKLGFIESVHQHIRGINRMPPWRLTEKGRLWLAGQGRAPDDPGVLSR